MHIFACSIPAQMLLSFRAPWQRAHLTPERAAAKVQAVARGRASRVQSQEERLRRTLAAAEEEHEDDDGGRSQSKERKESFDSLFASAERVPGVIAHEARSRVFRRCATVYELLGEEPFREADAAAAREDDDSAAAAAIGGPVEYPHHHGHHTTTTSDSSGSRGFSS